MESRLDLTLFDSDGLSQRASHNRPADVWISKKKTRFPKPVILQLPPASAQPHETQALRYLQRKTSLYTKRPNGRCMTQTTHATRTASASPQWVFDGHAGVGGLRPQPRHLDLNVTPRVPFCDVTVWLLMTPAPNDC